MTISAETTTDVPADIPERDADIGARMQKKVMGVVACGDGSLF